MGKVSDLFSMSKQERMGAWMIALLIVVLLLVVVVQRKCASANEGAHDEILEEYVEKAQKSVPKEKEKAPRKDKNKNRKDSIGDKKKDRKSSTHHSKRKEKNLHEKKTASKAAATINKENCSQCRNSNCVGEKIGPT